MEKLKRYAWDVMCVLFCLLLALGIVYEVAYGAESSTTDTVLLDFYSDWCGPCQKMAPAIEGLEREGYAVQRINIDEQPDLASRYQVTSIPCFVIVHQQREIDRVTGMTSVERLKIKLQRKPAAKPSDPGQPNPAWRYEQPTGHRAAIVRIYCQDTATTQSIGSGTLVRWGKRVVVLTARHVVQDAKRVVVEFFNKQTRQVKILKADAIWDCAVLDPGQADADGTFDGVQPVELEYGDAAMQQEGNRLESCGYGGDGKLACNTGLFVGYRRSTQAANGPDDWMVISGHARQGDSGGGVFNAAGRLVGVLWGYDDGLPTKQRPQREPPTVSCVQAGRIHIVLDDSLSAYQQQAILQRSPTAPRTGPLIPVPAEAGLGDKPKKLPWRDGSEQRDRTQMDQIDRLIALEELRAAREAQAAQAAIAAAEKPTEEAKPEDNASPLIAGLCILVAVIAGFVVYFSTQKN